MDSRRVPEGGAFDRGEKHREREPLVSPKENIGDWRLLGQAKTVFAELKQNMAQQDYKAALESGRKFVGYLEQMEKEEEAE